MARITFEQIMEAVESGEYIGICIACGHEQEGVEPDGREYECEDCGKLKVYGAEELMLTIGITAPSRLEQL